jgi:hypothetical protein
MSLPGSATSASAGTTKLVAAHQAFLQARGLQRDFPSAPAPPPTPEWLLQLLRALKAAGPVMKIVFWAGVAVGVAALVWVLVRDLPISGRFRRRKHADAAAADWRPEAGAARALLQEADRLAEANRFDEAIHLLLFRSIEDIGAKRPEAVRAALTSRDIVELAPLSDAGREAFQMIADAVERSFFGGRPAGRDEFDRCRGGYEAFALAEVRS